MWNFHLMVQNGNSCSDPRQGHSSQWEVGRGGGWKIPSLWGHGLEADFITSGMSVSLVGTWPSPAAREPGNYRVQRSADSANTCGLLAWLQKETRQDGSGGQISDSAVADSWYLPQHRHRKLQSEWNFVFAIPRWGEMICVSDPPCLSDKPQSWRSCGSFYPSWASVWSFCKWEVWVHISKVTP